MKKAICLAVSDDLSVPGSLSLPRFREAAIALVEELTPNQFQKLAKTAHAPEYDVRQDELDRFIDWLAEHDHHEYLQYYHQRGIELDAMRPGDE